MGMTKIKYVGPHSKVKVSVRNWNKTLHKGEAVKVPADVAVRLLKNSDYVLADKAKKRVQNGGN